MKLKLFQIDVFTDELFAGNPAAVCPLEDWLDEGRLQAIAAENNLSETAFFVHRAGAYELRWFTPTVEVDLCGHATLAAGFVIFNHLDPGRSEIAFETRSGPLMVTRLSEALAMDLPALPPEPCEPPAELLEGLGVVPERVLLAANYLAVFDSEAAIVALRPRMAKLGRLENHGVIVTAPGEEVDFVSRFFAPGFGVPEDPVTGSAHCTLVPYWSKRLRRRRLRARQLSARGGEMLCQDRGDWVRLEGRAVQYLEGTITI